MLTPLHLLLAQGRAKEHPVCHNGQRFLTWGEFSGQVTTQIHALQSRQESRWLLVGDDPQKFVARLLALLHAGKQVVIPPNTQPGTLAQLAHAFDAVYDDKDDDQVPVAPSSIRSLPALDPHTAAIDLYTSGSTGQPKQIRKTLAQLETEIAVLESQWGAVLDGANIIASAPHQHCYGLIFRLLWPLAAGRPFDTLTCAEPHTLGKRLAQLGQCVLISSPALLSRLPDLTPLQALQPAPKHIFSSGGPLPASAAQAFLHQLGQAPTEIFGSTETGAVAWRKQEGSDAWTPIAGNSVDIASDGALLLHSPYVLEASPWRMDDRAELQGDGRFRLLGRMDRVVKIEEKRLSLPDMEQQLLKHPWVASAAVAVIPQQRQYLGAVVVLTALGQQQLIANGKRTTAAQLRQHLAEHFETVLLPKRWRFPEHLPLNDRGKLTLAALTTLLDTEETQPEARPAAPALWLPEVMAVRRTGKADEQIVLDLRISPELAYFPGHFPGLPILPGVVQIDWAMRYAREHLAVAGSFVALENIKFLAIVLPDACLELTLAWSAENSSLTFSYATTERKCSSGRVVLGGGA